MIRWWVSLPLAVVWAVSVASAAEPQVREFENERLKVRLVPRTPEQIAAFYIGRKFPAEMVDELRARCFFTVLIQNKSDGIIWLDLDRWRFLGAGGEVQRFGRAYWRERWEALDMPLPARSTFRWTLLPESLDFRPGEAEGGNIVLPRTPDPFTIEAPFATGAERTGEPILVRFERLHCAE